MRLERYSAMSGVTGEIHQPTDEEISKAKKAIERHHADTLNRVRVTESKIVSKKPLQ
jgi:hypothetical protein